MLEFIIVVAVVVWFFSRYGLDIKINKKDGHE